MTPSHDRREFLKLSAIGLVGLGIGRRPALEADEREVLYNGIVLGRPWPPRYRVLPDVAVAPPYLDDPPDVIDIDVGRQLFIDDFLIEDTTLHRTFHHASYHSANPVLRPTTDAEHRDPLNTDNGRRTNPTAMPFSDGVFWDPRDVRFRMWYMCGYNMDVCHAVSDDGVAWTRTPQTVVPGTNIVLKSGRDSSTVWLDYFETDPARRYKLSISADEQLTLYGSADGLRWTKIGTSGRAFDRSTFFYNAFRRKWVFSVRGSYGTDRVRYYHEGADFLSAASWRESDLVLWTAADRLDPVRPGWAPRAELYNLDAVSYESVLLGLFSIWRGEPKEREKINEICLGYSRDGFHWSRPDRQAFIGVSDHVGDWNWANVQSVGGGCLVVGDQLYFYVSGRSGVPGTSGPGRSSTGLAVIRRDGFASMERLQGDTRVRPASLGAEATLTTRPLRFSGSHLFVNADVSRGELRAEVLDEGGQVIAPFARADCEAVRSDGTRMAVRWRSGDSLRALAGRTVRLRFYLTFGRLYAFWVSRSTTGASGGYLAAGGPGFPGPIDTAGDGAASAGGTKGQST